MTTLFVNACMRKNESRTLGLCREYLEGKTDIVEVDLSELNLQAFDAAMVNLRTSKQNEKDFDDPIFDLAKQFAQADEIVIGAPYWDLSFPAALKIYIEHISVCDVAFCYTEEGQSVGLCKADKLIYITTLGGFVDGANLGYEYICAIAQMFGISQTHLIAAYGLDIIGADIEACLDEARAQIAALK